MKKLICVSGLDGAGKTTQCKLLYKYLLPMKPVYYTFGNKGVDKYVNRALVNFIKKTKFIMNDTQIHVIKSSLCMYFEIKQLAQNNDYYDKVVIMDRYVETMYAHAQLYGLTSEVISDIFEDVYIKPDLYLFLDLDPIICYKRILQRGEGIELHEELDNLIKLYGFYKDTVKMLGINLIDANKTPYKLHKNIRTYINQD